MNKFNAGLLLLLIMAGCANPKSIQVNVYAENRNNQDKGGTFVILAGKEEGEPSDAQRSKFQGYIEKALLLNGFKQADELEKADVAILLSYGVGPPSERDFLTTDSGLMQDNIAFGDEFGSRNYIRKEKETTYLRYLIIGAVDIKEYIKTGKIQQLWRVTATNIGTKNKLDRIFPFLVVASQPYFGKHLLEKTRALISREDEALIKIKADPADNSHRNEQ